MEMLIKQFDYYYPDNRWGWLVFAISDKPGSPTDAMLDFVLSQVDDVTTKVIDEIEQISLDWRAHLLYSRT